MHRFVMLLMLSYLSSEANTPFCVGYQDGYVSGYCYQEYSCLHPIKPICPIPNIGEKGYQDGYNRGFVNGNQSKSQKSTPPVYNYNNSNRVDKLNSAASSFGDAIAETRRQNEEKKRIEEASKMELEIKMAELKAKSIEFGSLYPNEPNPYLELLNKIEADENNTAKKVAVNNQSNSDENILWVTFGVLSFILIVVIAAAN